jgi:hypothetical protein
MTTIKESLTSDLKASMRSGDRQRRDTLRLLLAAVKQVEVDQRTTLDDQQLQALLHKEAKKRQESIADFTRAGRPEAADTERAELAIIEGYLPAQATPEEITSRAAAIIEEKGLSGPRAIGLVMKQMMAEFQGTADGRQVNEIVRKLLGF